MVLFEEWLEYFNSRMKLSKNVYQIIKTNNFVLILISYLTKAVKKSIFLFF